MVELPRDGKRNPTLPILAPCSIMQHSCHFPYNYFSLFKKYTTSAFKNRSLGKRILGVEPLSSQICMTVCPKSTLQTPTKKTASQCAGFAGIRSLSLPNHPRHVQVTKLSETTAHKLHIFLLHRSERCAGGLLC